MRGLALGLALLLAGCFQPTAPAAPAAFVVVQGWIVDERLVPIVNASVTWTGTNASTQSRPDGFYRLEGPVGVEGLLVFEQAQHAAQARAVSAASGRLHWLNVTLVRLPVLEPYAETQSFQGILRCGVVATTQEDPSRPHEHQGVRCSQTLNDTSNRWEYTIPSDTTGIVVEAFWDAQSPVAQAMVLKIVSASGEVFGFAESTSPNRLQLSSFKLQQELAAGSDLLVMTLEPGAGTGNHEHGAVGAFVQQSFTVYATAFFHAPVPPTYSIEDA